MTRAEQYRQHATEAEQQAKRAADRDAKEGLQDIARQWRELAEQSSAGDRRLTDCRFAVPEPTRLRCLTAADCGTLWSFCSRFTQQRCEGRIGGLDRVR
jgi:hypothetical protein